MLGCEIFNFVIIVLLSAYLFSLKTIRPMGKAWSISLALALLGFSVFNFFYIIFGVNSLVFFAIKQILIMALTCLTYITVFKKVTAKKFNLKCKLAQIFTLFLLYVLTVVSVYFIFKTEYFIALYNTNKVSPLIFANLLVFVFILFDMKKIIKNFLILTLSCIFFAAALIISYFVGNLNIFGYVYTVLLIILTFETLKNMLLFDNLTRAKNRLAFDNFVSVFNPKGVVFDVYFMDIDDFKGINNNHGHDMGDKALIDMVDLLTSASDDKAQVFRYGGDEFIVIIRQDLMDYTQKFNKILDDYNSYNNIKLKVSIGKESFNSNASLKQAIISADANMYINKREK